MNAGSMAITGGSLRIWSSVDDLDYELLAWLALGTACFRPREAIQEAEEAFPVVVEHLGALRDHGLVKYRNEHVTTTESGIFLGVGPVQLTPAGKDALEHDQRLGPRPPRSGGLLPWRSVEAIRLVTRVDLSGVMRNDASPCPALSGCRTTHGAPRNPWRATFP